MRCVYVVKERKRLNLMSSRVKGWHELGENEKVRTENNGQGML